MSYCTQKHCVINEQAKAGGKKRAPPPLFFEDMLACLTNDLSKHGCEDMDMLQKQHCILSYLDTLPK